jgi:TRAP-type uncharacterized transport system fused permease subunit
MIELAGDSGFLIPIIAAHLFVFYFGILADDTPPVGIAAYAAAGIAKSDPIKTGIQGFVYDMRTAILPFMFFFNPSLLLIDKVDEYDTTSFTFITNPIDIIVIFVTALLGMFAFSIFTQGWFIKKTSIFERLLFLVVVPLMFLPNLMVEYVSFPSIYVSYALGLGIFTLIYLYQKWSIKKYG